VLEAEGMAEREHELTDSHAIGVGQAQHGELARIDLHDGDVDARVTANYAAGEAPPVCEPDLDPFRGLHHVSVGDDGAVRIDDEP
jgi:hypothetical protein